MPHYDDGGAQFLTWRLDDSIPAEVYLEWKKELSRGGPAEKKELYRRVEKFLDGCHGSCILREPTRANIVANALRFYDGKKYDLHAYVVMPNHVHVLLAPLKDFPVSAIVQSLKGFTGKEIQRLFGSGRIWQPDYFDRAIRSAEHFERVVKYIEWNPVKAKLCFDPKRWAYSSARE